MSLDGSLPFRSLDQPSCFAALQSQKPVQQNSRPHPLSNTLSPSSSNSSITDDTSLQAALGVPHQNAQNKVNFSKSLPIGALRPRLDRENEDMDDAFETPDNFRNARPLPSAFMSTGLISKRNRNTELPASFFGTSTYMPDTPSKKASLPDLDATPVHSHGPKRTSQPLHEFGSPTTPFSPHAMKGSPESFGKGVSIFGSRVAAGRLIRRASFLSIDGDDVGNSPTASKIVSQTSIDELPPTPTKTASLGARPQSKGKGNSLRSSLLGRRSSLAPDTFTTPDIPGHNSASKLPSDTPTPKHRQPHEDIATASRTPFITFSHSDNTTSPSLGRSRVPRPCIERSPSPLSHRSSHTASQPQPISNQRLKPKSAEITIVTAPPPDDLIGDGPLTPLENFTPPDASRLSINSHTDSRGHTLFGSSTTGFPPATPTGPRDHPFNFSVSLNGASSSIVQNDVDTTLTSRFEKVQVYGVGEFSIVYRVEQPVQNGPAASLSYNSNPGMVWAVKKSKKPYAGSKDRARKMKEVQILRALSGGEHIIETVDTWEMKNHLYIQTEFCENGNLKDFLESTGFKARLDDFRIWKILLELTQVRLKPRMLSETHNR